MFTVFSYKKQQFIKQRIRGTSTQFETSQNLIIHETIYVNNRPITGASMNPARSLGPAIVHKEYRGIWIYLVATTLGAVAGTWAYTFIRYTNKPVREISKSASFLRGVQNGGSK